MTRTRWWQWMLGTYAIITIWFIGSPLIAVVVQGIVGTADTGWRRLVVDLSGFIAFFIATPLVWRYLLRRPALQVVTDGDRIRWSRIGQGFGVWFGLSALSAGIDFAINSETYRWSFSTSAFIPFLIATLVLLPIQTSAEELFFRGWIIQWARTLPTPAVVAFSGTVFALPHLGNPEASGHQPAALIAWFVLGAGWAYVSVRDRSIELALGAHFANNLFALLVVGYDDAALPTSAVVTTSALNIEGTAVALAVVMLIFVRLTRTRT